MHCQRAVFQMKTAGPQIFADGRLQAEQVLYIMKNGASFSISSLLIPSTSVHNQSTSSVCEQF